MDRVILISVLYLGVAYATTYQYGPVQQGPPYAGLPGHINYPAYLPIPCDVYWLSKTINNCSVEITCIDFEVQYLETLFYNHLLEWKCYADEKYDEEEEEIDDTVKHIILKVKGNRSIEFSDNDDWLQRIKQIILKDNPVDVPEDLYKLTAMEDIEINNYYIHILNFTRFFEFKDLRKLNVSGNSIKDIATNISNETPLAKTLEILDLSHNLIENVVKHWKLGNFPNLTYLDLSHNAITNIDVLAFEGLKQLRILYLSQNHLLHIGTSLSELHNIEEVTFDHNEITAIEINDFTGLNKIEKLNLSSNVIQFIGSLAFANLVNLKELDLSYNELKRIEKILLRNNTKLSSLSLRNNNIETIEPGSFAGKNITKFDIQNNDIIGLIGKSFQAISVQNLDLSNMKISHIESMSFNSAVHYLNLSHNFIYTVSSSAFSENKHLKIIDLSHNQQFSVNFNLSSLNMLSSLYLQHNNIQGIHKFSLKNLTSLEELDLSDNHIHEIENKSFTDLKNLEWLHLNNNIGLRKFVNGTFIGLESLLYLDISNTSISELQNELFFDLKQLEIFNASNCHIEKIQYNAFKNLDSIETMDLSFNLLTEFLINNKDVGKIKVLDLKFNKIKSISDKTFHGLSSLTLIELSNNNIVQITDYAFDSLTQLKNLNLAYNTDLEISTGTFHDLALIELNLKYVTKRFNFELTFNTTVTSLDLSFCQIENVDNLFVYMMDIKELVLKSNEIIRIDKHSFQNLSSLEFLDLSCNSISYIQPGTFLQLENLKILNLHDNNISKLELGAFEGLKSLQTLNLSNNEINSFQNLHVRKLHSLETISLDNNRLESIMFTGFLDSGIEKITVGGNNIPCSDITHYNEPQRMYHIRRNLIVTAEVLDFHSENVDGIQCSHKPNRDETFISPQTNATYVLANAIEKLQAIVSNKTNLLYFDGNSSKAVHNNDTSQVTITVEDLNTVSNHLKNEHSDVKSLVYVTVVCLVIIVIIYLTVFISKVKHILRYRFNRSHSAIPLVSNSVEMQ